MEPRLKIRYSTCGLCYVLNVILFCFHASTNKHDLCDLLTSLTIYRNIFVQWRRPAQGKGWVLAPGGTLQGWSNFSDSTFKNFTYCLQEFWKLALKRCDVLNEVSKNCNKDDTEHEYYAASVTVIFQHCVCYSIILSISANTKQRTVFFEVVTGCFTSRDRQL